MAIKSFVPLRVLIVSLLILFVTGCGTESFYETTESNGNPSSDVIESSSNKFTKVCIDGVVYYFRENMMLKVA